MRGGKRLPLSPILTRFLTGTRKSTKLIHGDVRYLRKVTEDVAEASTVPLVNYLLAIPFDLDFVKGALRERKILLQATSSIPIKAIVSEIGRRRVGSILHF